ncbi:MAG: glycosyltransferase family 87 protein [Pseudolabrys sp.]
MTYARGTPAPAPLARPLELICFALIVAHAVYLAASWWTGSWIVGPDGKGIASDFVNVWAAGKLTLDGTPAVAYDWPAHKAVEELAVGKPFDGYFGWHYPPMFLFAAATLALMPYAAAYALWAIATFPVYLAAMRGIVGDRAGYLIAAAFPAVLSNFIVGQNGFLTAGLIGGTLLFIERRPVAAGVLLGLLTYKPHLGLLFPLVLAVSGHWRVFFVATIVAVILAALSWLAFGTVTWFAFFNSISQTSQAFLSDGWANWGKLQTAFGITRALGGGETLAWTLHGALALLTAIVVCVIWRSPVTFDVKAAALATGAMLATPYLYTYDLVVLAIPLAFLFRLGRRGGFLAYEWHGMALTCLLVLIFPFVTAPVGFLAVLVTATLVVRRALRSAA